MNRQLSTIMKRGAYALIFSVIFWNCGNTPQEMVAENQAIFHTTDPSRLYFQNTRGHQYKSITQQATRIDHYYLKAMEDDQLLFPIIANNWLSEEAYILLKSRAELDTKSYKAALSKAGKQDTLSFSAETRVEDYDFCKMLYTKSKSGYEISILTTEQEWVPAFENKRSKEQFYVVMRDYFRLTEEI